ncbi:MAG: alpha/beta fold hydrolase [Acidimicrobiales bacterium]
MATVQASVKPAGADAYGSVGKSEWLDVDWTAHQRWERIQGRWLNLIEIGTGPPLVFVHGLCGCWQNWLENICVFARDHRVIAMDLPGFGCSEMPEDRISIPGYANALEELLDVLGIDGAIIVGNSMGGFVAAEIGICSPERVERLCLVAAAGLSVEHMRTERTRGLRHRAENLVFFCAACAARSSPRMMLRPRVRQTVLRIIVTHPEDLPGPLMAEQVRGAGTPGFQGALDALTCYPISERLHKIACPTLIVWGDKDRIVPYRDAAVFHRLIAGSRLVTYADTGHLTMIERPERFNHDLRAFLESSSLDSSSLDNSNAASSEPLSRSTWVD